MIDAVIPVWKPVNWTSFDVVKKIRGQIKPAKVGHAGTLDPFAEGVLMLCTGKYTKKVESFMDKEKEYIAEIQLGVETDTLDPTGKIVETSNIPYLTEDIITLTTALCFINNEANAPELINNLRLSVTYDMG